MTLPEDFLQNIKTALPNEEFEPFVKALCEDEQPVSVRRNPAKMTHDELMQHFAEWKPVPVPWCETGYYLSGRPQFTLDPLFHAGCYYVQEASSMFISHIIKTFVHEPVVCLDLCAAPGGKSTAAMGVLPVGSFMVSNEIDRRRARILAENITKWGNPDVAVTANAPRDFSKLRNSFDVIITDVPCSGEGMFRKDEGAISDWSPAKVESCAALQHEILNDIWDCLRPGGLLIYSTCTFNTKEDEEMIAYICDELGGEALEVPTEMAWHIHPPLTAWRNNSEQMTEELPCYRFMPHFTKGEGLFIAAIRKAGEFTKERIPEKHKSGQQAEQQKAKLQKPSLKNLFVLQDGIEPPTIKGKDVIPSHAQALATEENDYPHYEVDLHTALDYLRRLSLVLPEDAPRGYVVLTYKLHSLGFVKNLGNRCNNLYPQEWRIRNL